MLSKRTRTIIALILLCSISHFSLAQSNSVLSQGEWIKLKILEAGIYKLSFAELQEFGLDPSSMNPDKIKLYTQGSGMLPQPNDSSRISDLAEQAIQVVTAIDGQFSAGDYILFYGEGADYYDFDQKENSVQYQKHHFAEANFYYLTVDSGNGKRITDANLELPGSSLTSGFKTWIHEEELSNILHSGRQWYGEKFDLETSYTFTSLIENLTPGSEVKIISSVMAASTQPSSFDISINGNTLGTQNLPAISGSTYGTKGAVALDTFKVNQSELANQALTLSYVINKSSGVGYLDYFAVQAEVALIFNEPLLQFYIGDRAQSENRTVSIINCPTGLELWDVTDRFDNSRINYSQIDDKITFNISGQTNAMILFDANSAANVDDWVSVSNQNLHGISNIDLLIVSPEEFQSAAQKLSDLRSADGLISRVVSPSQVYNEFSSGKQDITAIRDLAKHLYDNAGLQYLLLFGKGTYDPKDILESKKNKIPIYGSRSSLNPLSTYGSDDYLGFLEESEGYWAEDISNDHSLDIGVGRIPVTTLEEAERYITKLEKYQDKSALGSWRQDVVFIAENGDGNIHQRDAERLSQLIDTTYADFNTEKIYVDAYQIEQKPGAIRAPDANQAIYNKINNGALIVNYTGHGNESQWANTKIFDKKVIDSLLNSSYLSVFVTATCEFGRHDDIGSNSGSEDLLLKNNTGAIACITTTRPVFASSNYQLNLAFYKSVFEKVSGKYKRLGDIFKDTKNNSLSGVLNRNFSLLGDPSLILSYGKQSIFLDSINGEILTFPDTLKTLEKIKFSGSIRKDNSTIDIDFNGVVDIVFFDKSRKVSTLGNLGGSPFNFSVRDNILFNGSSSVKDGNFDFEVVMPQDISYNLASAKINMYASRNDSLTDASGANIDILVGRTSNSPIVDSKPPLIELYLGDTSFREGQVVNPSTLLIARIGDENGINTSNSQVGHSITYKLDGGEPVSLNAFYKTIANDFTDGWLYFNLPKLSSGEHQIVVTAWDTSNNSSSETINFYVSNENELIISDLSNYPNPMNTETIFTFAHNLSGHPVTVLLKVMNTNGQVVYTEERAFESAPSVIDNWRWDGSNASGAKLNEGIYIYGIFLRSTRSNLGQSQYSRLIITN